MRRNQRLVVAAILAAVIAGVFWSQSRIPALNEKAQMGLRTSFGELAFEIALPLSAEQHVVERILRSSVNWAYTNLQGMTFGLLFAAAVLTILANLRRRQFDSPSLNAISGVFVGAPLGVCVNCATPIAFGIYSAGARLETALASLVASPTLNAIVLTMGFTLLPWEMAVAKTAGVVLVILCIPFFVRKFAAAPDIVAANRLASGNVSRFPAIAAAATAPEDERWPAAAAATVKQFAGNLWFLVKFAVPLMLLAGVLGAVAIELVPFETFNRAGAGMGTMLVAALVATFLPVPIAFDVVVVMALLSTGVDAGLAATLLFALGIYSIYPAIMIARYISTPLAVVFGTGVVAVAVVIGLATQLWIGQKTERNVGEITAGLERSAASLVADAAAVCGELEARLQRNCFARHTDDFLGLVGEQALCASRPAGISETQCTAIVTERVQTRAAFEDLDTAACAAIPDSAGRDRCIYAVTLRSAQRDYDVGRCDVLPDRARVARCRADYLNASLLFNPDDSACRGLTGSAAEECRVNARIYRHADTLDIAACDTLEPPAARDHCRYTIASTMIGRLDDASGCNRIVDPAMSARCNSLPIAWRAAAAADFTACEALAAVDLRETCLMRVSARKIETILARHLVGAIEPVTGPPAFAVPESGTGTAPELAARSLPGSGAIAIEHVPFAPRQGASGQFLRVSAQDLGIQSGWTFSPTDFFEPFIIGKGIASGDFNDDGWPDIALATERGVRIYRNVGGRFELSPVPRDTLRDANLFVVAFVDIDGDGWEDLFASAYGGMNYVLRNNGGGFERGIVENLPGDHRLTLSAAFGDLDRNGEIDIVLGNWSSGLEKLFAPDQSGNVIMMQSDGEFTARELAEVRGETNSVLISDIDADGLPDVLVGNDRLVPDLWYKGSPDGGLEAIAAGAVPLTTMFTMSIDSSDFDNDLDLDIFSTDMTFARSSRDDYCAAIASPAERARCAELLDIYEGILADDAAKCGELTAAADRQSCFSALTIRAAKSLEDASFCAGLAPRPAALRSFCAYVSAPAAAGESIDQSAYFPQTQRNTLLLKDAGGYEERAESMGVSSSFWSWNAKAADLDNDGWQDIYVGNGFHFGENFFEIQENVMFRNLGGERFDEVQSAWGLDDPINTPSYTYVDVDVDGDLDIVATGVIAGPRIYLNELPVGNSIGVRLRDERGNRAALGAMVTITYGEAALRQRKELKLGGGFLSFDNPVLYFGIGEQESVEQIDIRWPDGSTSELKGPFAATGVYRISRRAPP